MKRALAVLFAAAALALAIPVGNPVPALADSVPVCVNYANGNGKETQICSEWDHDSTGPVYWAKGSIGIQSHGFDPPYAVKFTSVILWSEPASQNGNWCEGKATVCDGTGDGGPTTLFTPTFGDHVASDHYGDNTHLCIVHSEVDYKIYWTQTHFDNNNPDVVVAKGNGINSPNSGDLTPHCT